MDTIPADEFLPQAQQLKLGQKRRVDHLCGGGRTMIVENKQDGYSAWCYRCSAKGWEPKPKPSLKERLARLREVQNKDTEAEACSSPPKPSSFSPQDWPLYARTWLYKGGLNNDVIQRHGLYYSEALDRVVLPIIKDGSVIYWQARGFDKDRAKYLNPAIDKPLAAYGPEGQAVVVTEDLLSAIRVGGAGFTARCILGTSISDQFATQIAGAAGDAGAYVWLDPDKAGRKGRSRVHHALLMQGVDSRIIRTEEDPKAYSDAQIKEYIRLA